VRCYWDLFGGTCQELGNSLLWLPDPTQKKEKKKKKKGDHMEVHYQISKWKVNSGQSVLHQTQLERKKKKPPFRPPPTPKRIKREAPSLHEVTSDWSHGNSIPKIGCNYFWPTYLWYHSSQQQFCFFAPLVPPGVVFVVQSLNFMWLLVLLASHRKFLHAK